MQDGIGSANGGVQPANNATKSSERTGTKLIRANRLQTSHPKLQNPETDRESPVGEIAIQKRQSIFDSGLARGRSARLHGEV